MKEKSVLRTAFEEHPIVTTLVLLAPFGFFVAGIAALIKLPKKEEATKDENSDRARG